MNPKRKIILATALCAASVVIGVWLYFAAEPIYKGKKLTVWVREVSHLDWVREVAKLSSVAITNRTNPAHADGRGGVFGELDPWVGVLDKRPGSTDQGIGTNYSIELGPRRRKFSGFGNFSSGLLPKPKATGTATQKSDERTLSERNCLDAIQAGGGKSVPILIQGLRSDDMRLSRNSAWALGEIGLSKPQVVPALVTQWQQGEQWSFQMRAWAWQALSVRLQKRFSKPVSHLGDRRWFASDAIIKISSRHWISDVATNVNPCLVAVPVFAAGLCDTNWLVSGEAARLLAGLGPVACDVAPELARLLTNSSNSGYTRERCAAALGKIGVASEEVVSALVVGVLDKEDVLSDTALASLGELGSRANLAVPTLVGRLQSANIGTRHRAYDALRRIDPESVRDVMRNSDSVWEGRGRTDAR